MSDKSFFKSAVFKIFFVYGILSLINLSFIISIISENQVELISNNTVLAAEKKLYSLVNSIRKFNKEAGTGSMFKPSDGNRALSDLAETITPHYAEYAFLSERGEIIAQSSSNFTLPSSYREDVQRAMTAMTFSGGEYYMRVDETDNLIHFYVPLNDILSEDSIIYIRQNIERIADSMRGLYKQSIYVIIVVLLFHALFAGILYRYIIVPVKKLSMAARAISEGNLSLRVDLTERDDEFGSLSRGFNLMADSYESNMRNLSDEIEAAKKKVSEQVQLSVIDELTSLPSYEYMLQRLREELQTARSKSVGAGVLLLDIESYAAMNQMYGVQTGKIILLETSRRIVSLCPSGSIVGKCGPSGFFIILKGSREEIEKTAENIRAESGNRAIVTPDGKMPVTLSGGCVSFELNAGSSVLSAEEIVHRAVSALKESTKAGGGRLTAVPVIMLQDSSL